MDQEAARHEPRRDRRCTSIRTATSSRRPASPASPTSRRSTRPTRRGYTIKLSAYGARADGHAARSTRATIFNERGLGTPKTFRAGGWTADINTLLALADNGYVADTSALNWMHIEEWQGKELYTWNMTHWASDQRYEPAVLPEHDRSADEHAGRKHGDARSSR